MHGVTRCGRWGVAAVCGLLASGLPAAFGQASSSSRPVPEKEGTGFRRLSIGARVNGYPFNVLHNKEVTVSPANSTTSWDFKTTNNYRKISYGPSLEVRLTHHFAVNGELLFHGLNYTKTTQITDTVNGNTGITENTWATFWDFPIMLRYRGLGESGFLRRLYFAGGPSIREVRHIRSSTETDLPDGTITTSNTPIVPTKRRVTGAVVGMGFRLVDDFNIKVTPEVRYTRWLGASFASDSTRSARNQVEVGIGLTF